MRNRWDSTHRCCQEVHEEIPANNWQAGIFLDNAYWHLANLGSGHHEAKAILHRAYLSLPVGENEEAA